MRSECQGKGEIEKLNDRGSLSSSVCYRTQRPGRGSQRPRMAKKLELQESLAVISIGVVSPRVVRYVFWGDQWCPLRTAGQMGELMEWARILAYITGTVDQELLPRNEYLAAENQIQRAN